MKYCIVKVCRNYLGRKKTSSNVTYHRIPSDPVMNDRWVNVLRRSLGVEYCKPTKGTYVCSDHFHAKELYFTSSQKRRRLKRNAVPSKALFLSSYCDISENSDEQNSQELKTPVTNRGSEALSGHIQPSMSTVKKYDDDIEQVVATTSSSSSRIPILTDRKVAELTEVKSDIIEDFSDLDSIFDSPRKAKLRKDLRRRINLQKKQALKIKSLRQKNFRLKKKIATHKDIIGNLKKNRYINNDLHQVLSSNVFAADLYLTMNKKIKNSSKRPVSKYSPEYRKFCLTLHFLSPKAYSYVRRKFESCLPHPKTLGKWYAHLNGSPGLTEEAFKVLKDKRSQCEKNMVCALMSDEMAIRQQKCYNPKTGQDEGLIDIGTGTSENMNTKASEAYVFLLVSLNEPWKLPLGYFLVHGMTGEQKANIIKTILYKCYESGVDVVSITFDGHRSNLSAMEVLGCKYNDPKHLKTTFRHPCADYDVAVLLDFCHMLKLIRNHFESKETFLYKDTEIKWEFLKKLVELQEDTGLHLANRLTQKHIEFRNSIMNVKLATQLLSRSVSKALEFCRVDLKLPEFIESEATERFILTMNNIFDVFNSRNLKSHSFKHPLFPGNKSEVFSMLEEAEDLILNLHVKISRKRTYTEQETSKKITLKSYTPVLESQSFTGFVGVLICIKSLKFLYESLIDSKKMNYLSTYRLSQDHIELFFGAIRMHGGTYNDNPNARQLKGIYRKLLCHMELKTVETGNCIPLENISILMCSSSLHSINATVPSLRTDDADEDESEAYSQSLEQTGSIMSRYLDNSQAYEYVQQIVGYLAGFVVRCLLRHLKCMSCIESLTTNNKLEYHKLVNLRNDGGLIYASRDVYEVCKTAEDVLRKFMKQDFIMTKVIHSKIMSSIMKHFIGMRYFRVESDHVCGIIHQTNLLRLVAEKYVTIRCFHLAKLDNLKSDAASKRKLFRKQIQREGH